MARTDGDVRHRAQRTAILRILYRSILAAMVAAERQTAGPHGGHGSTVAQPFACHYGSESRRCRLR